MLESQAAIMLGRPQGIPFQEVDVEVRCPEALKPCGSGSNKWERSIQWTLMIRALPTWEYKERRGSCPVIHQQL